MIKIGAQQNYSLPVWFAGSRPAMTMLALAPPSIAIVSFNLSCATPIPQRAIRQPPRRYIGRLPNKLSKRLSNTPPAAKSP
jgi:hypothetical protein